VVIIQLKFYLREHREDRERRKFTLKLTYAPEMSYERNWPEK
jgi:hypothetical protein